MPYGLSKLRFQAFDLAVLMRRLLQQRRTSWYLHRFRPALIVAHDELRHVNLDLVLSEVTVGAPSTQWWISLSTAIVFGLGFATILTLIVTPAALLLIERMAEWRKRTVPAVKRRIAGLWPRLGYRRS